MFIVAATTLLIALLIWLKGYGPADPYEARGEKPPAWTQVVGLVTSKGVIMALIALLVATFLTQYIGISWYLASAQGLFTGLGYLITDQLHEKRKIFVASNGNPRALYTESTTFADKLLHKLLGAPAPTWNKAKSRTYGILYGTISGLGYQTILLSYSWLTLWAVPFSFLGLLYGIAYGITGFLNEKLHEPVARGIWGAFFGLGLGLIAFKIKKKDSTHENG